MKREGWDCVVIAATGPSFDAEQVAIVEAAHARGPWRLAAISDNWNKLPRADIMFAPDRAWWRLHGERAKGFAGERWTVEYKNRQARDAANRYGLQTVKVQHADGLSTQPETITVGGNAGHMLIHLVYLFGPPKEIVLVGYDMQKTGGRAHNFGNHPRPLSNNSPYPNFIRAMGFLARDLRAAGVNVTNCTAQTALECFPRADLAETLAAR